MFIECEDGSLVRASAVRCIRGEYSYKRYTVVLYSGVGQSMIFQSSPEEVNYDDEVQLRAAQDWARRVSREVASLIERVASTKVSSPAG